MFNDILPIDWEAFHFLRPAFLWLLLPTVLIFALQLLSMKQKTSWKKVIAPHLRKYMISKGSNRRIVLINLVAFMILVPGILGIAGPTWKKKEIPGRVLQTPMTILLELSESMEQTDLQPSRVGRAMFKIKDFLDKDPQARVSLIGFAGTAHTIVPLTQDYNIIKNHIDGLNTSVMPVPGSDLQEGLKLADTVMSVTDAPGTILLMTDELEQEQIEQLQEFILNSPHRLEILNLLPGTVNREYLSKLGVLTGYENVKLNQLTLDNSDVELIADRISKNLEFTEAPEEKDDDWRDAGLLLVIPMAIVFLLCFRRGWSLYVVLLMVFSSCSDSKNFQDLWYTKDYQAQKLADKGNYADAAETFQDPLRKGIASFKANNFEEAIRYFNEDTTAMGHYNLGLAYYKSGDLVSAQLAFQEAIELDPSLREAQDFNDQILKTLPDGQNLDPEDATEAEANNRAQNKQNNSMEDLSGGGQEATEEDMEKERQEETAVTDIRKGKELDEVPDDIGENEMPRQDNSKVLMEKIDDDPSLFLKRKFRYQVKKANENSGSNNG